jgi:uncharacterized membrane protein YgdD (TMEM256/DUF423 family)
MSAAVAAGAVGCALAILAGAFGAHTLRASGAADLALWETAARYLMYGSLGLVMIGLAAARWPEAGMHRAAWAVALGTLLFSATVAALALGGPRWLGAVTPVGGTLMIVGFLLLAWGAFRA